MNRRNFISISGQSLAALLLTKSVFGNQEEGKDEYIIGFPDKVSAWVNGSLVNLKGKAAHWEFNNLQVGLIRQKHGLGVEIQSTASSLEEVVLQWDTYIKRSNSLLLNDHWERTYGDVSWHSARDEEIFPWYFMEYHGDRTSGFGIKTGAGAFCYWRVKTSGLELVLDSRSGGNGVDLKGRKLQAATIVTVKGKQYESPFHTTRRFTTIMCDHPRLPKEPVYGINDWYYTYGDNSDEKILAHTRLMAPMAEGLSNRPFSIIDAGWYQYASAFPGDGGLGDRMDRTNAKFADMNKLSAAIKDLGMRPGIWTRPLCGSEKDPANIMLPLIKGRDARQPVLDPSIPENIERIKSYFRLYKEWGFELVKFDYTSDDIFGKWGFQMLRDKQMTEPGWSMNDRSRTNAEIVLDLYNAIRDAAGDTYIIGCNTFSHLSAGVFELNRIGDDTSGREWDRTRKMGVNTVAFRGLTHNTFYAADGDCVGLTTQIDWEKNRQWMELLAKAGVPLLISAQPEAVGDAQKEKIKECFGLASKQLPLGEPLDWLENPFPAKWKLNGQIEEFNW